jgi:5-methylcytosine-specific restriction endonuclease McrA
MKDVIKKLNSSINNELVEYQKIIESEKNEYIKTIEGLNEKIDLAKKVISDLESKRNEENITKTLSLNSSNDKPIIGISNLEKIKEEAVFDAITFFEKKCPYCDVDLYANMNIRHKMEIDHFYPIAKGGQDFPWNIIPICKKCNRSKSKKNPSDFLSIDKYTLIRDYLENVRKRITNNALLDLQRLSIINDYVHANIEELKYIEKLHPLLESSGVDIEFLNDIKLEKYKIEDDKVDDLGLVFNFLNIIKKQGLNKSYWYDKSRDVFYLSIPKSYSIYCKIKKDDKVILELNEIRKLIFKNIPFLNTATPVSMKGQVQE